MLEQSTPQSIWEFENICDGWADIGHLIVNWFVNAINTAEKDIENAVEVHLLEILHLPALPQKVPDKICGFKPYVPPSSKTANLV